MAPQPRSTRLKVVIASLIAATSMIAAVAAWRASVAASASAELDRKGFADTVSRTRKIADAHVAQTTALRTYLRSKLYAAQADSLRAQAAKNSGDAPRLLAQAQAYAGLARYAASHVDPDALAPNGTLDLERQFRLQLALARQQEDIDPTPEFERSDHLTTKSERLVGLTAFLVAAAFFFTLAQVSRRRVYLVYLATGIVVVATATGLLIGVELAT